jgi:hypothetical protein
VIDLPGKATRSESGTHHLANIVANLLAMISAVFSCSAELRADRFAKIFAKLFATNRMVISHCRIWRRSETRDERLRKMG